jgi:lipoyl(octanoyl) transferase
MDFCRGWAWQQLLLSRRLAHRRRQGLHKERHNSSNTHEYDSDTILFLEHAPVYTLGRGADENYLKCFQDADSTVMLEQLSRSNRNSPNSARLSMDRNLLDDDQLWQQNCHQIVDTLSTLALPVMTPNGVPIYRVERGGEVTFHGPGQLVVYPLLDLQREPFRNDLRWYLRMIEQVLIDVLKEYNIEGVRDDINTGVWVEQRKIAAVGVSASRWITSHGFALNVTTNLDYFDDSIITPCGIEGRGVTSVAEILHRRGEFVPPLTEVASVVFDKLQGVFGIELEYGDKL